VTDDFMRALRGDLVEAMERYERRSLRRRLAARLRPPLPPRATLGRLVASAAVVVALVVAAREFTPAPEPARPRIVAVLSIGGTPVDGVLAEGALWTSDFTGSVVRIDPGAHRTIARIDVPGAPEPVTAGAGSVWVQTAGRHCEGDLVRIDAVTSRVVGSAPRAYPGEQDGAVAADGDGAVWVKRGCAQREGIDRVDGAGEVTARITLGGVDGLAAAGEHIWAIGHDGTLTQIDRVGRRVVNRWPGLAPLADPNTRATKALAVDGGGVWALSTGGAEILHVDGGRIVQRIPVNASVRPIIARAPDGLWITSADRFERRNRLIRIDPRTGEPTATLDLGDRRPLAIVPAGEQLCVLTADGTVLFVSS
jgi:hypothetical protein